VAFSSLSQRSLTLVAKLKLGNVMGGSSSFPFGILEAEASKMPLTKLELGNEAERS
jgi:hypothetical protein